MERTHHFPLFFFFFILHTFWLSCSFFITATTASGFNTNNTSNLTSCLQASGIKNFTVSSSPPSSTYSLLLNSSIRNLRFAGPDVPKPQAIILPSSKEDLQNAVLCLRKASLAIRVRSGGHSYEGLSYTADHHVPFAVIDLMNLNRVHVDPASSTAWVESGATLGEIYYAVAASNRTLAFSAGSCTTVGSGGQISGGGFGLLSRKYGLAADNVLDSVLVDATGRSLDRESMGEDVFWAIRGGGGGSWGAVYAWKLRLVPVPQRVSACSTTRSGSTRLISELVHKWQLVAPDLPDELYLSITVSGSGGGNVSASFLGFFLLGKQTAVSILTRRFPELGLTESDCDEVSWIDSVVRFAGLNALSELRNRGSSGKEFSKFKSDYVRAPIGKEGLTTALDFLSREQEAYIILDPYGGEMARVRSDQIPFPHRAGILYGIQYAVSWTKEEAGTGERHVAWLRSFYEYMGRHVSKNPREAYVNYLDLDLGRVTWSRDGGRPRNAVGMARVYGERYFLRNFHRLVKAKTQIDPNNVFNNPQSIPPLK
ncbi:reticuline oxidase-like [Canna indica]|uniref:Reticuline oxidase-like n=1 Tax=Canna indica TaxID=4628 RepID=A0AAQ3JRI7_9LILI|nr:reticuline oxidase-like [Canna indica]